MRRQLLVESIRVDGKTQSRERINEETVKEYAEAMQAPPGSRPSPAWPPVTVFFDGREYWMADGFHRLLAVKRIGKKNIAADVRKGTREEAAWAACGANLTHGLRRTNADKRKSVETAVKLHPEMSAREIARHVGVHEKMVRKTRSRCGLAAPERVVGKDGKSYRSSAKGTASEGIGPPPTAEENRKREQKAGDASEDRDETPEADAGEEEPAPAAEEEKPGHVPVPPPPAPKAKPEKRVDGLGRVIPEHLEELWNRGREVQDMLTALSRIRVAIRKAQETNDPLFSSVPYSAALAHLDQAYDCVQVAKPYAVCAFCQGEGCKACKQRGLLSKFRWDTTVPKEHKEAVARLVERERASCG